MTKIKICGLKRLEDIKIVNKYLPEYIGFVFADSKRRIDKLTALTLNKKLDQSIQVVGVFVNEPIESIVELCKEHIIDIIQLHGDEDEEYIKKLKSKVKNPIIKAVGVENKYECDTKDLYSFSYKYPVDYMLFDTAVKGQYGGSGVSFNHSLLSKQQSPFFLAGGLDCENVEKAIGICRPYCVDVSSGVETDGFKDEIKIKDFINAVRQIH
ncbi:MAG: hypothetical protein K0S61_3201 [Anaerocolumna sp.]|jgi:phosphoribosylanthranilate isomerase|nr:hypothetical protein [Anaerocolumna sp.]